MINKMKTKFDPLAHGYKFANRFEFSGLQKLSNHLKNKLIYGMCGGMIFSALDHYFDQKDLPVYHATDELSLNYAKYLWNRQKDSLSTRNFIKILIFASLPKKNSIQKSVKNELPKIIELINDTLPAPIVIIRSNLLQNPTHNHQVLVTQVKVSNEEVELILYDPNHPSKIPAIVIDKKNQNLRQTTGEFVRGFFVNNYLYKSSLEL
jgi:hypothetical protein